MWVGESHHDKRIQSDIKLISFGVLTKEGIKPIKRKPFLIPFLRDNKALINSLLLLLINFKLLKISAKIPPEVPQPYSSNTYPKH